MPETVDQVLESGNQLYLIEKDMARPVRRPHTRCYITVEDIRITKIAVRIIIQRNSDDPSFRDPFGEEVVSEELEKQIRFPAPSDSCDDFDRTVVLPLDQPFKVLSRLISVSPPLLRINCNMH